ncbi:MAG: hypothetical protein LBE34_07515 [Flavobacteriaceae bacterium]|jgi:hypothetical protein|nr:hypothetical protein [Flavobacteriaceae bacterium]
MKQYLVIIVSILCLSLVTSSCKDDSERKQQEIQKKLKQHNDSVFQFLAKNWKFVIPHPTNELKQNIDDWSTLNDLKKELTLAPVSTIGAFQKKAEVLSQNALNVVYQSYPAAVNYPDVKARYTALLTSIQNLEMYITVDPIDIKKVDHCIKEVQNNLRIFYAVMEEELVRTNIPKEEGEQEMIQEMQNMALDPTRNANPEDE